MFDKLEEQLYNQITLRFFLLLILSDIEDHRFWTICNN
jgi:hypothetical protein